jgi:hypothetical protein
MSNLKEEEEPVEVEETLPMHIDPRTMEEVWAEKSAHTQLLLAPYLNGCEVRCVCVLIIFLLSSGHAGSRTRASTVSRPPATTPSVVTTTLLRLVDDISNDLHPKPFLLEG